VTDSDLMFRPASELAEMVRSGELSSRELVQTSLERIEELNPALNAFVQVDDERALAAADEIGSGDERPFAGVPIAIKNNRPVAGLRLTYGCELMSEYVADYDHNITRRLRDAGFVIVGTTTLPEYGILPVTEARMFGPTRSDAPPAARRAARPRPSPRGSCRSRMATTVVARSAFRRPAAAWWG
jgi:amidase